jgi:DNA-binding XRE family transcriptional regulator
MPARSETVRKLREESGQTVTGFAKKVGLHRNTIYGLEVGKLALSRRNAFQISNEPG